MLTTRRRRPDPPQAEDWHGNYWTSTADHRTRQCSDPECLWGIELTRSMDGWWWTHQNTNTGVTTGGGPFTEWQAAAQAALRSQDELEAARHG